jgi:elongation factor G
VFDADIINAIRKGTIENRIVPVCCGSAFKNKGVQYLLDSIINFLPSPEDMPTIEGRNYLNEAIQRKPEADEPFSALVFKITSDKYGQLSYIRVYSGNLDKGSYVVNTRTRKKFRIGRLVRMFADKREDIDNVRSGDIAAAVGVDARTGDTLSDVNSPIILESLSIPIAVIELAIEANSKADQERMSLALGKLSNEDPSLKVIIDHETNQTKIGGMGELHLDIIVDRLKREYKLDVNVGKPQVAYKETIQKKITAEGKYIKQTGGRGQYGHVWLEVSPGDEDFVFDTKIVGGAIPKEYIGSIKKGIVESLSRGCIAGYPLINIHVLLFDGSYHDVDSSDIAFKIAGSMAFRKAVTQANPMILEPIMNAEVITPEKWLGDVISDLNGR